MLTSKTFIKKTKKGGVLKVVREHYLRDDICCGSTACKQCEPDEHQLKTLSINAASCSSKFSFSHYIIPDTNVLLHQVDVMEHDVIKDVIILQTVLDEIKHRNLSVFKRVKDLLADNSKRFYTFSNEYHKETYIERQSGESANDRNDRAIRVAAKWYQNHLGKTSIRVVLLTNDKENLGKALTDEIQVLTIEDYVMSIDNNSNLQDRLAKSNSESKSHKDFSNVYSDHLNQFQINNGVLSGKFKQGTYLASRENYLEGSVRVSDMEEMILVQGLSNQNRAVQDDIVAVEVFSEDKWTTPSDQVLVDATVNEDDEDENATKTKPHVRVPKTAAKPTGRIVGIVKRNWRGYCGILLKSPLLNQVIRHLFQPADRRIPKVRIETRQAEALQGKHIVVAIDSWARSSRYPQGHLVRILGDVGDKATESELILFEHDVPHHSFPQNVLNCLPKLPWLITEQDFAKREDLRHITICSVDPPGCTDIDDALHCRELENGNYEVGVHIADVSHFIRPGTALDIEAASRGTTVYLVDRRIDMVPELLSSNLCSLRGNEERFAFSTLWEITKEAEIKSCRYTKSVICSKAAMTYAEAQNIIDDSNQQSELAKGLRRLNSLAKILKQRRIDKGALLLASPEVRFIEDSETHDPVGVEAKQLRETNSMVEEFMLLANVSVAQTILDDFPECAMLRRHPSPPISNFAPLLKAAHSQEIELKVDSGKSLSESLSTAHCSTNPFFNTMLRILATRCMVPAEYFCSGSMTPDNFRHFGLAAEVYTHFTSPIRRYADIIVHRLLAATIGQDSTYSDLLDKKKSSEICKNINFRHKMAQYAGRSSVNLHTHLFFRDRIQLEEGYVLYVKENALQILVYKYGLEATLFLQDKKSTSPVKWTYDPEVPCQKVGDVVIRVFDKVTVQLFVDKSNVQHLKLAIRLVEPQVPGFSLTPEELASTQGCEPPVKKRKS